MEDLNDKLTVKTFGTIIDKYKIMKNTLKFFWPVLLLMLVVDEYAIYVGNHMSKWWIHLVVLGLIGIAFFIFHKMKRKV